MLNNHERNGDNAIIGWLYEVYREQHPTEHDVIKENFAKLYEAMNGIPLAEVDRIIYPVCMLSQDHERIGFCEGVRIGVQLAIDLQM